MSAPQPPQYQPGPPQYQPGPPPYQPAPQYQYAPVPPVGPAPGVRYGTWLGRFVAYLIDGFIIGVVVWAFYIVGFIVLAGGARVGDSSGAALGAGVGIGLVFVLVGAVVGFLWKPYFWSHGGQTPGYKMLGMRVVRARDGGPVSFGTGILRMIGYIINDIVFGLPLGFIWAGFDSAKQGWHDKIAGTVVIQA
jgi:uncharacterized RDD family membrane protein YckC